MAGTMIWSLVGTLILALGAGCGGSGAPGAGVPVQVSLVAPPDAMPVPGEQVVLAVTSQGGDGSAAYQWLKNGQVLPGATGATLTLVIPGGAANPTGSAAAGTAAPASTGQAQALAGVYQAELVVAGDSYLSQPFDLEPVDAVWTVTSTAASGPGTLADTLAQANAGPGVNGIRFALPTGPQRILLQDDLPAVTGSVCILGPADGGLTVDGGGAHRPLLVNGGTLVLDHFTIANGLGRGGDAPGGGGGAAGMGGGLFINAGAVTLRRMLFQGNQALGGTGGFGGDGSDGGGGGFGGDSPTGSGMGAGGGLLGGEGGTGHLDGSTGSGGGGTGSGAGGGAARGVTTLQDQADWISDMPGGEATWGGGGGFSVGPGGGGGGSDFGGGGGGSGGRVVLTSGATTQTLVLPGAGRGPAGFFGGDGSMGDGVRTGQGGGGGGMGGAVFLRAGTLAMYQCDFVDNHALPGKGAESGFGKGGALFIYAYDSINDVPFDLGILQAQQYRLNTATDLVEDAAYDNNDYYVAQTAIISGNGLISPLDLLYRRYRLQRDLGPGWLQASALQERP